jgi:hypothetical protein
MKAVLLLFLLTPTLAASDLHPPVMLRDASGESVLSSGAPVSTLRSCSPCHDTMFIASHSYHAWTGETWNPLTPPGALKAGSAEWNKRYGFRHTGGGHALPMGVEPNCFLCHLKDPDNGARIDVLVKGAPQWAATATLASTGLVKPEGKAWAYDQEKFISTDGQRKADIDLLHPPVTNCGLCHGQVHTGSDPLVPVHGLSAWSTETTGQVFSWQQMSLSGANLEGREELSRAWDVHAERLLDCADCHPSLNNPGYYAESAETRPRHQRFEARKLKLSQFLKQPNHHFAKGFSVQGEVAQELDGTMRRCEDCHDFESTHEWLPYARQHVRRLLCEVCHIPRLYAPARKVTDWSVISPGGEPRVEHRGIDGPIGEAGTLVKGYRPVILPRPEPDGPRLGPMNLITTWYWQSDGVPVDLDVLKAALLVGEGYHRDLLAALDADGDGVLSDAERLLDSAAKKRAVLDRLKAEGVVSPILTSEIRAYDIHHDVAALGWSTRDCRECHGRDSILAAPFEIANSAPEAPLLEPASGSLENLVFLPSTEEAGLYVIGHDRSLALDLIGLLCLAGAITAAGLHGGLRYIRHRQRKGGAA